MSEMMAILVALGYTALVAALGWILGRAHTACSLKRDLLKAAAKGGIYTLEFCDTKMSIKVEEVE